MQDRKKKKRTSQPRSSKNAEKARNTGGPFRPRSNKSTGKNQNFCSTAPNPSKAKASHGNQKQEWKPGNMLYPVPAVLVTVADKAGKDNIITVAWTGTICTNPPMVSISVRPERYSYHMIEETGEFVLNLSTKELPMPQISVG